MIADDHGCPTFVHIAGGGLGRRGLLRWSAFLAAAPCLVLMSVSVS
jgi:hypothetical protein